MRALKIFVTGGIGDWLCVESFLSPEERASLRHIHWGHWVSPLLKPICDIVYPEVKHHYLASKGGKRPNCPQNCQDWSVMHAFPTLHKRQFQGSSFLTHTVGSLDNVELPESFVAIQPASGWHAQRKLQSYDWRWVFKRLEEADTVGVLLDGDKRITVPTHPRLLDHRGLELGQSIEVLKRASGYYGVDSCLSILAAQLFDGDKLRVRCHGAWIQQAKGAYYAPQTEFSFMVPRLNWVSVPPEVYRVKMIPVRMNEPWLIRNQWYAPGERAHVDESRALRWISKGIARPDEAEMADAMVVKPKPKRKRKDTE